MRASLILAGLFCQSVLAAELVGDWGDPNRLEFEGLKSFTTQDIRNGLLRHPDYLLASHPAAPLETYPRALDRMISLGFQAAGFPRPEVKVNLIRAGEKVFVRVSEGPRFSCGEVRILGARTLSTEALVKRLTETQPMLPGDPGSSEEEPLWKKGDYPAFGQAAEALRGQVITNLLPDLGLLFANTRVRLEIDETRGEADLVVDILDEGPPGKIGSIRVEGNKRDSDRDVIEASGLSVGMTLNQHVLRQADQRLSDSARFLAHRVEALLRQGSIAADVVITVRDYEPVRPLGEAWSAPEQAALRFRDWLAAFPARGDDLIITASNAVSSVKWARITISPEGIMALIRTNDGGGLVHAGWIASGEVSLMSTTQRKRVEFRTPKGQFTSSVSLVPNPEPEADAPFHFGIAAGYRYRPADQSAVRPALTMRLAPVAFLGRLHREGSVVTLEEGELRLESEGLRVRVDAATGRLLACSYMTGEGRIDVEVRPGVFRRAKAEVLESTKEYALLNNPRRIVTALARYGFAELALGPYFRDPTERFYLGESQGREAAADIWERLMTADALAPLDQLITRLGENRAIVFGIPVETQATANPMAAMMAVAAAYVFQSSNELFPKQSWPWTVARETVFVALGKGQYTGQELDRLYGDSEMGPLGYLAVAKLLSIAGERGAGLFAVGGLTRLSSRHFHQDWRLLVEGQPELRESVERLAVALAGLSVEEVNRLGQLIGDADGKALTAVIEPLRATTAQPNRPPLESLGDFIWERLLRERVRAELRKLVN